MVENARAFQMHCASASWLKVDQFDFGGSSFLFWGVIANQWNSFGGCKW